MYKDHNNSDDYHLDAVSVVRALTPDYHYRVENDLPLKSLPYVLQIVEQPSRIQVRETVFKYGKVADVAYFKGVIKSNWNIFSRNNMKIDEDIRALADNRLNKLLAKVKGQSLPLLMLYKERKQTASMISEFLKKAKFTIRYIKHPRMVLRKWGITDMRPSHISRVKYALKRANTYGDAFLAYRFAWTPFLSDIIDLYEAQAKHEKKGRDFQQTAGLPFEFTYDNKYQDGGYSGLPNIVTCSGRFRVTCRYRINDITLATASEFMDLPTTLWDAVPWSFMIDRLINISKYLDLRNATAGTAFIDGSQSLLKETIYSFKKQPYKCDALSYKAMPSGAVWDVYKICEVSGSPRRDFSFVREVLTAFPDPILEYPYEDFFDGIKLADDIALLGKQFGRLFKPH